MNKSMLYTGSYNTPVLTGDGTVYQGNGGGIVVYSLDEEKGLLEEKYRYSQVENASWMVFSQDRRTLYAVNELDDYEGTKGGAVSAYSVDEQGGLTLLNCLPVMGAAPCHVDHWGRDNAEEKRGGGDGERKDGESQSACEMVFTANYNGGNASIFRTAQDGSLAGLAGQICHRFGEKQDSEENKASERNQDSFLNPYPRRDPVRQEKPHVHSTAVCDGYLWITDLGMDEVSVYRLDGEQERCSRDANTSRDVFASREKQAENGPERKNARTPEAAISFPAGSGPRSIAFGKKGADGIRSVYITCELSNEIAVLCWDMHRPVCEISMIERVSALPEKKGQNPIRSSIASAVLSPDGRFLYAGNRGHDSIAVFETRPDGRLCPVQWIPSGGSSPRGIQISPSGKWLLAANQNSGSLVIFQRDAETGRLTQSRIYRAGAIVCLEFL